ncbi:hypothetical protein RB596_005626 [Gaeumannomyces avenae]
MAPISFDHKTYSGLSTLGEAVVRFNGGVGQAVLDTEIRTEGAADLPSVGLLHRHFDMDEDETLVEHGSTSTPWKVPQDPADFMGGRIAHAAGRPADAADHAAFVGELQAILRKHDLDSTLSLVSVTPDYLPGGRGAGEEAAAAKCERTFGRANVVFDIGTGELADKDKRTSVWVFGRPNNSRQEAMLCFSGCMCQPRDD